ncbi:MAG TPA: hypothetical protein VJ765_16765 [Chitinophagaceae bacterium]|nr:hypothetical protein [Chitinophagaceae bacterium]
MKVADSTAHIATHREANIAATIEKRADAICEEYKIKNSIG